MPDFKVIAELAESLPLRKHVHIALTRGRRCPFGQPDGLTSKGGEDAGSRLWKDVRIALLPQTWHGWTLVLRNSPRTPEA